MPPSSTDLRANCGGEQCGGFPFLIVRGKKIDVNVRITNMPEDNRLARIFVVQLLSVEAQHFTIPRHRNGEIRADSGQAALAGEIVNGFRQGVPELAEALAVRGGRGKPGTFNQRAGGSETVEPDIFNLLVFGDFLLSKERGASGSGNS